VIDIYKARERPEMRMTGVRAKEKKEGN